MTQAPSTAGVASEAEPRRAPPIWTRSFVLLCIVTILCYFSNYLVAVVLPLFVQSLGGTPVVAGLVFTSFSVTSFILRPLIGHLIDTWSVRGTLFSGGAILGALALVSVVPSIWVTVIANAIRGVGWGAFSTATSTAVALTAPPSRRGEASGYFGMANTAAVALAPALAIWLFAATGQFPVVFALGGVAGLAAAAIILLLPRIGSGATTFWRAFALSGGGMTLGTFIERPVLLASLLLVCVTMTSPVTFAFVPLHARDVGVDNISWYFVASGATSILARVLLGRLTDRGSRGLWVAAGYSLLIAGFLAFTMAYRIEVFIVAAFLNGFGQSLVQPALMALAMDRADPARIGKAMATYSMSYRVGEGIGAPVAGALIVAFGYTGMYLGAIGYMAVGLLLTALNWRTVGKPLASSPSGWQR
jgi:MFS family permease